MRSIPVTFILTAGIGLSLSGYALAQTGAAGATPPQATNPAANPNTGQINNPSAIPPPAPTPAPTSAGGNLPINPQQPQMPPVVGTPAPTTAAPGSVNTTNNNGQVFSGLDRSQKGYLSPADVTSNKYLSSHFQQCDSNGDGRLTQAEVGICMQQSAPVEK